jgi:glycerophosphoryl diester phosphodiesterase
MAPPVHDYIENTIRSMSAAFEQGATVVEFDVRLTADENWAVFHDRRLDCRTNGAGLVREHTMEELKALDVGYGYTADGGVTYPFRGQGEGAMPSLAEVFEALPEGSFLVDLKENSRQEGALLAQAIGKLSEETRSRVTVFGRDEALDGFREVIAGIPTFSFRSIQTCLVAYLGYGWTGVVPSACRNVPLYVPINVAPFLWGWPNRFMDRIEATGSSIVVVGRFGSGAIAPGLDTIEDLERLPSDYNGGIWTNNVGLVSSAVSQ